MASDLSQVFKNELTNTLEQLLGKKAKVEGIKKLDDLLESSFIECDVKVEFKDIKSGITFFIPASSATKFEYLMLGGMGDLKQDIDDETTDAVNEIISNISGSFATASNAQGLADISGVKVEIKSIKVVDAAVLKDKELYKFDTTLDGEQNPVILYFDKIISPFFSSITGAKEPVKSSPIAVETPVVAQNSKSMQSISNPSKNLELLYHVKLKLSVRLGSKIVLLKDILRWDVGEIIELEQMVNEPLEILINGVKIGEGEAVIVEGKFGIKIRRIVNEDLQLDKIGL